MKIYLAGPMRGKPADNREAFAEARQRIRDMGHIVFCPSALGESLGLTDKENRAMSMKLDFTCIEHADEIAVLPGWEGSVGATLEVAYAQFLGMPIRDAMTFHHIDPVRCPWYELKEKR